MNPKKIARRVYDNARTFGVRPAAFDFAYLGAKRVFDIQILKGMTAVMADADPKMLSAAPFQARFAKPEELERARRQDGWEEELNPSFLEPAFAKGDECFAIFDGDKLASVGWYARTPTAISTSQRLHFDPSWAYMYKGYTIPAYRGKRLHGIGMSLALQSFSERGARGLISYVEFNNLQSLRSVERTGYRLFGDIYLANIGGRERSYATPGCRAYGFYLEPIS
jgi:hypothetical protein